MTTLNPSHNPFRPSSGRHAQAVHRPSRSPSSAPSSTSPSASRPYPSAFPDNLPGDTDSDLGSDDPDRGNAKHRARKRVKAVVPPLPDLRFEQVGRGPLSSSERG